MNNKDTKTSTGLSNIDNELHEICKNINIIFNPEDSLKDGHLISDNAIMSGSIFPHGRYKDTEGYSNEDNGSFQALLNSMLEK